MRLLLLLLAVLLLLPLLLAPANLLLQRWNRLTAANACRQQCACQAGVLVPAAGLLHGLYMHNVLFKQRKMAEELVELTVLSSLGPGLLPCLLIDRVIVPSSPPKPVADSLPAESPDFFCPNLRVAAQHQ